MKYDEETKEEVRTLIADRGEIHEVTAKAWQDIFKRWDKEAKPTWQHDERIDQHLWDTQQKMEVGELQIDQVTNTMEAWGAKRAAGTDGWAGSEWKQRVPEM